jgi:hypothetical protein
MSANVLCTASSVTLFAGSSIAVAGDATNGDIYRGYLSFDLTALNSLVGLNISAATLNAQQTSCYGNPFGVLFGSAIEAWHVSYGSSLTAADCSTANLGGRHYVLSTNTTLSLKTTSVLAAVRDDYVNRVVRGYRSQYQLRTAALGSFITGADWCAFGTLNQGGTTNDAYLTLTYEFD